MSEFTVEDTVRIKSGSYRDETERTGRIIGGPDSDGDYKVFFGPETSFCYFEAPDLELLPNTVEEGSRVRVKNGVLTGSVTRVYVDFIADNGQIYTMNINALKVVE